MVKVDGRVTALGKTRQACIGQKPIKALTRTFRALTRKVHCD